MVPNGPYMIEKHIRENNTPYPILADLRTRVAAQYLQIKKFFVAGTPTVLLVDQSQTIRFAHYYPSLMDEPDNREPLQALQRIIRPAGG